MSNFLPREERVHIPLKRKKLYFCEEELSGAKSFFSINASKRGIGGIAFGSQFLGPGSLVAAEEGKKYIIRWVKVHFCFLYRFGLESA